MSNVETINFARAVRIELSDQELAHLLKLSERSIAQYRTKGMPSGAVYKLKLLKPNLTAWIYLPKNYFDV